MNPRDYCLEGFNPLIVVTQNHTNHLHMIPYFIIIDFYENLSDLMSAIKFAIFLLYSPLQIFDKEFEINSWSKFIKKNKMSLQQ